MVDNYVELLVVFCVWILSRCLSVVIFQMRNKTKWEHGIKFEEATKEDFFQNITNNIQQEQEVVVEDGEIEMSDVL